MMTKDWLFLTKKSEAFLMDFLGFSRLNLAHFGLFFLVNSRLDLGLLFCEGCSWFYSFTLVEKDEKVSKRFTSHNLIETRQLLLLAKEVGLFFNKGKVLSKCS